MLESLGTLSASFLEANYDVSTSLDRTLRLLLYNPYNLIISSVRLAEIDQFFLLDRVLDVQSSTPLVVTGMASDQASVHKALELGAFDLISDPLNLDDTLATIRLALWQNRLLDFIASKERALEKYRQLLAKYPVENKMDPAFIRALLIVEQTIHSGERTRERLEETLTYFRKLASAVKQNAQERALKRLNALQKWVPHQDCLWFC